jgi:hypothetical protein
MLLEDPLVPPIAHQYLGNRAQHDTTARQWTASYAAPPPPPRPRTRIRYPASTPSSSTPAPPGSRGKKRAAEDGDSETPNGAGAVIVLDDEAGPSNGAGAAPRRSPRKKRRSDVNGDAGEVVVLDSDDAPSPQTRRPQRRPEASTEVIELDDD